MSAPDRLTRVNEIIKRELADLIEKMGFMDGTCLISITSVSTAPNLRRATVNVSIFGGGEENKVKALRFLQKNRSELQKQMARHVTLKYTPVLDFVIDRNLEDGDRVLSIIEELNKDDD